MMTDRPTDDPDDREPGTPDVSHPESHISQSTAPPEACLPHRHQTHSDNQKPNRQNVQHMCARLICLPVYHWRIQKNPHSRMRQ